MKRLLAIALVLASLMAPTAALAGQAGAVNILNCGNFKSANGTPTACTDENNGQGSKTNPLITVIKAAIDILSWIIGIAAIIGVVVSGLRFITANGDSGGVASARSSLIFSLVGVAIAVMAQLIVVFVLDKLNI